MAGAVRHHGFSLTEVLLATGVLAVGFVMIAMVFPVGVWLTGVAADRTIGPVAAQEAIAKVKLYGVDLTDPWWTDPANPDAYRPAHRLFDRSILSLQTYDVLTDPEGLKLTDVLVDERLRQESFYPSLSDQFYRQRPHEVRRYCWTVLCRRTTPTQMQLRIFVCRKGAEGAVYYGGRFNDVTGAYEALPTGTWPMPVRVGVANTDYPNRLTINASGQVFAADDCLRFFTDGCEIVDDRSGEIYQVLERQGGTLILDRPWLSPGTAEAVWVVPPGRGSGKNPCIGIYTWTL